MVHLANLNCILTVVVIISNVTSDNECQRIFEKIGATPDEIDHKSQFCSGNSVNLVPGSCQVMQSSNISVLFLFL